MTEQLVTVNVHHPRVQRISRLGDPENQLDISLGNEKFAQTVSLLVTDDEWNELVAAVMAFRTAERAKEPPAGSLYCDDCAYVARTAPWLARHYIGKHAMTSVEAYKKARAS